MIECGGCAVMEGMGVGWWNRGGGSCWGWVDDDEAEGPAANSVYGGGGAAGVVGDGIES